MNILCCYLGIFSGAAGAKCAISPLLSYRVHMQCSFDFILVNEIINEEDKFKGEFHEKDSHRVNDIVSEISDSFQILQNFDGVPTVAYFAPFLFTAINI